MLDVERSDSNDYLANDYLDTFNWKLSPLLNADRILRWLDTTQPPPPNLCRTEASDTTLTAFLKTKEKHSVY
jgi:hypothetical protein